MVFVYFQQQNKCFSFILDKKRRLKKVKQKQIPTTIYCGRYTLHFEIEIKCIAHSLTKIRNKNASENYIIQRNYNCIGNLS